MSLNILFLYGATETFTNTVYEHVDCFRAFSRHRFFYTHCNQHTNIEIPKNLFDVVVIHYSVRLPYDQITEITKKNIVNFFGLKVLFIQDEYNYTHRAWYWINELGIDLVFTVVPEAGIEIVYPKAKFPKARFVSNLTGYVPEQFVRTSVGILPSKRPVVVGYRGRPLTMEYGQLGMEKIAIGKMVKAYCDMHDISIDIAWGERDRIYGQSWYNFVLSCRSMLGTESGSNVFDWDGRLNEDIEKYRSKNPTHTDREVYENLIRPKEIDGLMNQISPKIFEAIASWSVLVLFEGRYSDIIRPGEHYIALKKDGSNIEEVIRFIKNDEYVDTMAERAWLDIIASGKYSYKSFVEMVDKEIEYSHDEQRCQVKVIHSAVEPSLMVLTMSPIRANPPQPSPNTIANTINVNGATRGEILWRLSIYLWLKLPESLRKIATPTLKRIFKRG